MKDKILKVLKWDKLPILLFFIIITILHIKMNRIGDDVFFTNIFTNLQKSFPEVLMYRYQIWTSRIVIEATLIGILQFNIILWKVANIGIYMILFYSLHKLFVKENKTKLNWIIFILIMIIPVTIYNSAGWVATYMNYLWPIALGLYSMLLIIKILDNKKIRILELLTYLIAAIYACSQEQMLMIMFFVFGVFLIYCLKNKKVKKELIFMLGIIVLSIIIAMLCPGNENRKIQETQTWFPEFASYNIIDKAQLGIISSVVYLIANFNLLFITFILVILYATIKKYKDKKITYFIPIIITMFIAILYNIISIIEPQTGDIINLLLSGAISKVYNSIFYYITLFAFMMLLLNIFISIYLIFKDSKIKYIPLGIYMLGVGSRLAIGLAPTVYASKDRTCLFMYFSFIAIIIMIINELSIIKNNNSYVLKK